jgi:hypothetical protein
MLLACEKMTDNLKNIPTEENGLCLYVINGKAMGTEA